MGRIVRQFIALPKNKLKANTNKVHRNEGEKREKETNRSEYYANSKGKKWKNPKFFYLYIGKVYQAK